MQPKKAVKRGIKLFVNTSILLLSVALLVLVGVTQQGGFFSDLAIPARTGGRTVVLDRSGCKLNVGSVGVCAYSYVLGGVGVALALFIIMLAMVACVTDIDAPLLLEGTIHAIGAIWWTIGVAVLGTFVARANYRTGSLPADYNASIASESAAARVVIVLVALANCILYVTPAFLLTSLHVFTRWCLTCTLCVTSEVTYCLSGPIRAVVSPVLSMRTFLCTSRLSWRQVYIQYYS